MTEPFQSISDVSKMLGLPAHTLRYWEKTFPVAIKPVTGAGGRRYYRKETVLTLERVKDLLYTQGYTIAGVKKLLASGKLEEVADVPAAKKAQKVTGKTKSPVASATAAELESAISSDEIDQVIELLTYANQALT